MPATYDAELFHPDCDSPLSRILASGKGVFTIVPEQDTDTFRVTLHTGVNGTDVHTVYENANTYTECAEYIIHIVNL